VLIKGGEQRSFPEVECPKFQVVTSNFWIPQSGKASTVRYVCSCAPGGARNWSHSVTSRITRKRCFLVSALITSPNGKNGGRKSRISNSRNVLKKHLFLSNNLPQGAGHVVEPQISLRYFWCVFSFLIFAVLYKVTRRLGLSPDLAIHRSDLRCERVTTVY